MADNKIFTDEEIAKILELINDTRHTQYIGARYVPLFGRKNEQTMEWDNKAPYEPLTIVLHEGNSYTSRQYVPTGIDITNTEFWAETGNFNAQIEQYRAETQASTNKFAAMGIDTTEKATEFLNRVEKLDTDNEFNKNVIKAGFGADTVEAADTSFKANYMDIRKLGCKANDTTFDNAPILNEWIAKNPETGIYVPEGNWNITHTVEIKQNNIHCTGYFSVGNATKLTDSMAVYCNASDATVSADMVKNRTLTINVDGNMTNCIGVTIKGYFGSTFNILTVRCMAGGTQTLARNIENFFNIKFYGGYSDEYATFGFKIANQDNDNFARVIGRNATIGIDTDSSIWFFDYVHVWGCEYGIKSTKSNRNYINNYYCDYTDIGIGSEDTIPSTTWIINNLFGILPNHYVFEGQQNIIAFITNMSIQTPQNTTMYSRLFKNSPNGKVSNYTIQNMNTVKTIVDKTDLANMTIDEIHNKYGFIALNELINNAYIAFPSYDDYDPTTFPNTPQGKMLKTLNYPLTTGENLGFGKAQIEVHATYSNIEYPPAKTYILNLLNGSYIQMLKGKATTTADLSYSQLSFTNIPQA